MFSLLKLAWLVISRVWQFFFGFSNEIDLDPAQGRMRPVKVRLYAPDDFEACRQLYILNEPGRFPPGVLSEFEAYLQSNAEHHLVVERDSEICGCGGLSLRVTDNPIAHLVFGLVHPKYHGQGIGTTLLLSRLALLADDNWIVTLMTVASSRTFYERFNFREFKRLKLASGEEVPAHFAKLSRDIRSQCENLLAHAGVELLAPRVTILISHSQKSRPGFPGRLLII